MRIGSILVASLTLFIATICPRPLSAQSSDPLTLITPDAVAMISVQPALIARSKSMQRLPLEVISAAGLEYVGIDPLKLERIDVISGIPIPGPGGFPIAVCITSSDPIDKAVLDRFLPGGPVKEKGVDLWSVPQTPDFALGLRNANQAIIGPKTQVLRLIKTTPGDGELRKLVSSLGNNSAMQFVIALEPLRELMVESAQMPQLQSIPDLVPNLTVVAQKARMVALRFEAGDTPSTAYIVEGLSPSDTVELATAMKGLIRLGMKMGLATLENETREQPGKTPAAALAYAKRMSAEIESRLDFQPEGSRLSLKIEGQSMMVAQTGVLVGLLLPAVQSSREAARRMQSSNNMKQILLAMHNFEATYKLLPNDLGPDRRKTKANLSWRVHLLPYIEEVALYNEFHMDEPWDSPHNIKLLERMPATYRDPQSTAMPGFTVYQMARGENMINNPTERIRFSAVTDGLSNAIALLITQDNAAVPWTKPDDIDPIQQRDAIATRLGRILVGMADGSVSSLNVSIPDDVWKNLIIINDGQVVDSKYFTD